MNPIHDHFPEERQPHLKVSRRLLIIVVSLIVLLVAVAILMALTGTWASLFGPRSPNEPLPPLKGYVDARIWEPGHPERSRLRLSQPGALPVQANDSVRIEIELNRPAYVYMLWIDSTGHVTPLYPWRQGGWGRRPPLEKSVARLSLPDDREEGWGLAGIEPGMETVLLLAREEPLPRQVELVEHFNDLPRPRAQHMQAVVWFENGAVVRDEAERTFTSFDPNASDDPLLALQALLMKRLQSHFSYSRAVSFANMGR